MEVSILESGGVVFGTIEAIVHGLNACCIGAIFATDIGASLVIAVGAVFISRFVHGRSVRAFAKISIIGSCCLQGQAGNQAKCAGKYCFESDGPVLNVHCIVAMPARIANSIAVLKVTSSKSGGIIRIRSQGGLPHPCKMVVHMTFESIMRQIAVAFAARFSLNCAGVYLSGTIRRYLS